MNKPTLLTFGGEIGSGKSALSRAVAERLGWKRVTFVELLRAELVSRGIVQPTRAQLQDLGQTWVDTDVTGFARSLLQHAEWRPGDSLVIEAIRHLEILQALRELTNPGSVFLVLTELPEEVRMERRRLRGDTEWSDGEGEHRAEAQSHGILRQHADVTIDTTLPIDTCVEQVMDWLKKQDASA
ncbi:MAG TPA: AAA family ATPase [bacterium]